MTNDTQYMRVALRLAHRGLGQTWPNPAVGCVIVGDAGILGRGWTQPGGRPHAETEALTQARERYGEDALAGATAYVSLEPCSHHGKTPPCTDALIEAKISRVVVGCGDPDQRVSGEGIDKLRSAGIEVVANVLRGEAEDINAGFILRETAGRPLVTLKTATTADGFITAETGTPRWITGAASRERVHLMRAQNDAVMTGMGTVREDNPKLTCRLPGLEDRSPVRVVLDSALRIDPNSELIQTAKEVPTWVFTCTGGDGERTERLREASADVVQLYADPEGHIDIQAVLAELAKRGVTRLMLEAGAQLNSAFMRANVVDRISWFRNPQLTGGEGLPAFGDHGIGKIEDIARFAPLSQEVIGDDTLDIYRRVP